MYAGIVTVIRRNRHNHVVWSHATTAILEETEYVESCNIYCCKGLGGFWPCSGFAYKVVVVVGMLLRRVRKKEDWQAMEIYFKKLYIVIKLTIMSYRAACFGVKINER